MEPMIIRRVLGISLMVALTAAAGFAATRTHTEPIKYPEGYRAWTHVKSRLIPPSHAQFSSNGGFQHFYANELAVEGFRTRRFPEGSIIVADWLAMADTDGVYQEAARRQVDVMVKDSIRFAETGGWGFQRFAGSSKTELATSPTPQQCFACHQARGTDGLVLSRYRP